MKIVLKKKTSFQAEYTITRADKTAELITLDTKTYLLHDICHYAVEKILNYQNGFWGMLAQGYTFSELFGKNNPMTSGLRFIEQIVGLVQSVYSGHIPIKDYNQYISHLNFTIYENDLISCLSEVNTILNAWEVLPIGEQLTLEF